MTTPHRSGPAKWVLAALAALGLHAAVALAWQWQADAKAHAAGGPAMGPRSGHASASRSPQVMQVRWVPVRTQGAVADTAQDVAQGVDHGATPDTATAMATSADLSTDQAPAPADNAALAARPQADARDAHATPAPDDASWGGYARRDTLDRGPQALGIVQIAFPPGTEPGRVFTGRLTLFIDEAGAVRKVASADGSDAGLPPPLVEAAREAFLQARFAPGEREGTAVKSRIDIEVSFDDREAGALEASRQDTPATASRGTPGQRPV